MIRVIAGTASQAYLPAMAAALFRLLALVSLALLPFGMAAAPAEVHHAQTAASTASEHCADNEPTPESKRAVGKCAMACSAALPAHEQSSGSQSLRAAPAEPSLAATLASIELEIATPPPKLS